MLIEGEKHKRPIGIDLSHSAILPFAIQGHIDSYYPDGSARLTIYVSDTNYAIVGERTEGDTLYLDILKHSWINASTVQVYIINIDKNVNYVCIGEVTRD